MENQVWHPLAHSRVRYSRGGALQPTRPGSSEVLSPESEEGHSGEPSLAPYGVSHLPTQFHTYPRFTCMFWWHSGALGATPPQHGCLRARMAYPPSFPLPSPLGLGSSTRRT